jgi:hypothetical protein
MFSICEIIGGRPREVAVNLEESKHARFCSACRHTYPSLDTHAKFAAIVVLHDNLSCLRWYCQGAVLKTGLLG